MPFKEHPLFEPPATAEAIIWRYMDLAKFLSLLDRAALYFVRFDKLSDSDPYEGHYTAINVAADHLRFEDLPLEWRERSNIKDEQTFRMIKEGQKRFREVVRADHQTTFVSSWHVQEHESAAMWSLYVKSLEGIAVQSTYQRLIDSLSGYPDFEVHVGLVKYIDYRREAIPTSNLFSPFLHKRKSFEHEKELRALIWTPQHGKNALGDPKNNKFRDHAGLYVAVELSRLIERVYIAPTAPRWVLDLVGSVVKRFGLTTEVVQSDLASKPVY